jgi:hypothetical protein
VVEQRYHITKGILYNAKENLNPNYHWEKRTLLYNCDMFCITPEMLRKIFGKENRIIAFQDPTNWIYDYHEMGVRFDVNYIPQL